MHAAPVREVAAVQQAYALNLTTIVRIEQWRRNYRDHSDDPSRRSYTKLAKAWATFVAALPLPPDGVSPLRVHIVNEPNGCGEWMCSDPTPGAYINGSTMAAEFASFGRDVLAALSALPTAPRLRLALAPIAGTAYSNCSCGATRGQHIPGTPVSNGTRFIQDMLAAVPGVYGLASDLSVHPYPACQEPFDAWCARGWLAVYRDHYSLAYPSWASNPAHAGGRFPILVTETGWQSPNNETGKAAWMSQAITELFGPDPDVDAVLPFLLAGPLWQPDGWPWVVWANVTPTPQVYQPQYMATQQLVAQGVC